MTTVVHQSFRTTDVPPWIERCLASVRDWARDRGWDYHFVGDDIFELVPDWYMEKTRGCLPVATDLGRLEMARRLLERGYRRTIWLDADVLVFDGERFDIAINEGYAFGREIWIQHDARGRLKTFRNVHNAVSVFVAGNSLLDFYIHACHTIVGRSEGPMVPQLVGTKFLTALGNIMGFPLIDDVAMLSPLVLRDIACGGGAALDLLRRTMTGPARAANLCASLAVDEALLAEVCERLIATRGSVVNAAPSPGTSDGTPRPRGRARRR